MASPTAIKALTGRLRFQLDEPNISLDPLMTAVGTQSLRTAVRERLWFCWSVPIVWMLRVWLKGAWNASAQQNGGGDLWLVQLSPVSVSVEAGEGATSNSDGGKGPGDPRLNVY
jgi:hypothetical protein